jgi:hypothetical protein
MASPHLVAKLFSSIKYVEGPGRAQYLLFQLGNKNHAVGFTQLSFFFGFHWSPTHGSRGFNGGYDMEDF